MKNTKKTWIIKANTGTTGWKEIKRFDNPAAADTWLMDHCRRNGYSIADFTIKH